MPYGKMQESKGREDCFANHARTRWVRPRVPEEIKWMAAWQRQVAQFEAMASLPHCLIMHSHSWSFIAVRANSSIILASSALVVCPFLFMTIHCLPSHLPIPVHVYSSTYTCTYSSISICARVRGYGFIALPGEATKEFPWCIMDVTHVFLACYCDRRSVGASSQLVLVSMHELPRLASCLVAGN